MVQNVETMRRVLELSDSCLDGIKHLKARLNEGYLEDTILLLQDVVEAFYQMEKTNQLIADQLAPNQLTERTNQVRDALDFVVTSFEKAEDAKALEIVQFNLLPSFNKWKEEIERSFASYVI